jgi:hypothetical protein
LCEQAAMQFSNAVGLSIIASPFPGARALGRFHFQALRLVPGEDEQFRLLRIRSSRPPLKPAMASGNGRKGRRVLRFCGAGIKGRGDCSISNIQPSTTIRDGSYGLESGRGKSVLKWRLPGPRSRSVREAATSRRWRGSASVLGPGGGGRVGAATHGRTCGECR